MVGVCVVGADKPCPAPIVNTMTPSAGVYVALVGTNCLTNCSPTRGSDMPNTSVSVYPSPPDTFLTFVTFPPITVMSAVAPTPLPSLFLSGIAVYIPSLYPEPDASSLGSSLDIPTLTVIVSVSYTHLTLPTKA